MDNRRQEFVEKPEEGLTPEAFKERYSEEKVHVGQEFELAGRKFKIRKITHKDIICRPSDWNQGDDVRTDRSSE